MSDKSDPDAVAGASSNPVPAMSPAQREARALFKLVKREWYRTEAIQRPKSKDLEREPASWQSWLATPSQLPSQVGEGAPPYSPGSSVKIDTNEPYLAQAFRPRPFLLVSGDLVLLQDYGWVCPLSSSDKLQDHPNRPDWVVALPELGGFCLAAKIQMVDTCLYKDAGDRELLTWEGDLTEPTIQTLLTVLERVIRSEFSPKRDPVPPGSILRSAYGAERIVLATVALDVLYGSDDPLVVTARLREGPLPAGAEDSPQLVELPPLRLKSTANASPKSAARAEAIRSVDVIGTRTLLASNVRERVVGMAESSDLGRARDAWIKLLPTGTTESKP